MKKLISHLLICVSLISICSQVVYATEYNYTASTATRLATKVNEAYTDGTTNVGLSSTSNFELTAQLKPPAKSDVVIYNSKSQKNIVYRTTDTSKIADTIPTIYVPANASLTIKGGSGEIQISEKNSSQSISTCFIYVAGTLNIEKDVTIGYANSSSGTGCAIRVASTGTVNMNGGDIILSNNTDQSSLGGAISILSGGTFNFNSGSVRGNNGGSVGAIINKGTLNINGGDIYNNKGSITNGIYLSAGQVTLSGSPYITDPIYVKDIPINVKTGFSPESVVPIQLNSYEAGKVIAQCEASALDVLQYFKLDDSDKSEAWKIEADGNNLVLMPKTVTYAVKYVDWDGTSLSEQVVEEGGAAVEPEEEPYREGYVFTGWSYDATKPGSVTEDLIIYAQYDEEDLPEYTVTYLDWDGELIGTEIVREGKAAKGIEAPAHEGYVFTGWDKDASSVTENITLTAQYKEQTYTVTYVDYDGETVISKQEVKAGANAAEPKPPTREGYVFTGWDKTAENVTEDMTITAQYREAKTYTVIYVYYDENNRQQLVDTQYVAEGNGAVEPEAPEREGYVFTGWAYDATDPAKVKDIQISAKYSELDAFTGYIGDKYFYSSKSAVTEKTVTAGSCTITASVYSNNNFIILAEYSADGNLVNITLAGTEDNLTYTINREVTLAEGDYVKMMIWSGFNDLIPARNPVVITAEAASE